MSERALGDLRIGRVMELVQPFGRFDFFPDTTDEDWAPHSDWLREEGALSEDLSDIILPMQSYVVRTSHHTVLVDTCIGNQQAPSRYVSTDGTTATEFPLTSES